MKLHLIGWTNLNKSEFKWVKEPVSDFETYAYNGIFLAGPGFASHIPYAGKFSIIDAWLEMAKSNKITGYIDESPAWFDFRNSGKNKN